MVNNIIQIIFVDTQNNINNIGNGYYLIFSENSRIFFDKICDWIFNKNNLI